jgi:hypothetical protein
VTFVSQPFETAMDAGDPVREDWFTSSYVEIPRKP